MSYAVISASDSEELQVQVEKLLNKGWILVGGVHVIEREPIGTKDLLYSQAMVSGSYLPDPLGS